jgi:hypothetical protein
MRNGKQETTRGYCSLVLVPRERRSLTCLMIGSEKRSQKSEELTVTGDCLDADYLMSLKRREKQVACFSLTGFPMDYRISGERLNGGGVRCSGSDESVATGLDEDNSGVLESLRPLPSYLVTEMSGSTFD